LKRAFDLVLVIGTAPLWVPVLCMVAVLVAVKLGRPVLFRQVRPGLRGEPFALLKFRSMTDERGADGKLLPDERRLPPFGRWLRSTSLDELPELINILKGEMSLVGPRPLLMQYLTRYSPRQARRHEARPGLTGWAQVNGRNAVSWEDKFEMDVWYVENRSLWLDLKILAMTFAAVFDRRGINAPGAATAPEFMGSGDLQRCDRQA
jgi:lipopolysaccharide/colanic/teichoic acid biosynthesis glycosyltransferase